MKQFTKFSLRRLGLMIVSLYVLVTVSWFLVALSPTDPAVTLAGPYATHEQVEQIRQKLGLNEPLLTRYFDYMRDLLHGDLGTSIYSSDTVTSQIKHYLPSTAVLVFLGVLFGVILGVVLGGISAYWHRRWPDRVSSGLVSVLQSLPDFVVGVALIYVFFFLLGWLPGPEGQLSITTIVTDPKTGAALIDTLLAGDTSGFADAVKHAVLPVATLALVIGAVMARISRAALREAYESEQTKFAAASGLSEARILHYALLTARTPILTYGAIVFALGFGGTAIVETIFNWNGASQWAIKAMLRVDYPAVLGFIVVVGIITLVTYFLLDLLVAALDPRIRAGIR